MPSSETNTISESTIVQLFLKKSLQGYEKRRKE